MAKVWKVVLNTGATMPAFGLGTWLSKPGEVGAAVEAALKAGYRHIDCAHIYRNEPEIGEAFEKCFKEGVCKREDVFITSKLWNAEHSKEDVLPACELTLKNLKLDYLDLYLVHWPVAITKEGSARMPKLEPEDKLGYDAAREAATWEGMEELVAKGLVKAIGISNFSITKTEKLLETAKIVPAINQVECHPYFQQQKLKEYCGTKGIVFEAYSPLGNPGNPFKAPDAPNLLEDPVLKELATKHNTTTAQVCISFALHRDIVVLAKTTNLARVPENLKATELTLDAEDMRRLREMDRNERLLSGSLWTKDGFGPEDLWDTAKDEQFEVKPPEAKKQKTTEE